MERRAACHCGKLALRYTGEPAKVSLCHCFDCQRRTGSLFSIAAFFARADVELASGTPSSFSRASASGFDVKFNFCPACGSNLWWEPARLPDVVGIAAGAFADRDFPMPEQAVWAEEAHPWLALPGSVPVHARNPVRKGG